MELTCLIKHHWFMKEINGKTYRICDICGKTQIATLKKNNFENPAQMRLKWKNCEEI